MAEKSNLKRGRQFQGEQVGETKKPRRAEADAHEDRPPAEKGTVSPEERLPATSQAKRSPGNRVSSPSDTQAFSQLAHSDGRPYAVEDEEGKGVWGYIMPIDGKSGDNLVLHWRDACPVSNKKLGWPTGHEQVAPKTYGGREDAYETEKVKRGVPAGGYLIGRHPECDRIVDSPTVSNRHCLLFCESRGGDALAMLEDMSANGTFINDSLVGRNKRRELSDGDEIAIVDEAHFVFRYPRKRNTNAFRQLYSIQEQLGKGHFATVYLCIEKSSGVRFAVKKFEKRPGPADKEKSRVEGLQQEVAVLMGVSHPALLCLKATFDESDGVYLVLELAAEGELFNWIVMKQKLTEVESRKVFVQLFQGLKYLHERGIVHRDIKPENILLSDKDLHVKLADFGLAKVIGEESFTTTLCGTPSYVAPEILVSHSSRRYTRAVDVWSLGVVMYICLCGFPPFSDELCTSANPYPLSQQIKLARFDYPSPYWDSVSDAALDLIDRMLTVTVDDRITIDECLEHPWTTARQINPNDSTDGLTGAIANLDFSKRKPVRERTLLSSINDVKVTRVIEGHDGQRPIKVYEKNSSRRNAQGETPEGTPTTDTSSPERREKEIDRAEHSRYALE